MIMLVWRAISQLRRSESHVQVDHIGGEVMVVGFDAVMASSCMFLTITNILFMVLSNGISGLRRSFIVMSVSVSSTTSCPMVIWV